MGKFGIISDTHGYLDPQVLEIFAGVDRIFHAGDIGYPAVILELEGVAPVTAVLGNNDAGLDFRETEVAEVGGLKILVHHIVTPGFPGEILAHRLERERPDIVLFGHTHRPCAERHGGVFFLNPGYSGRPRMNTPRSVALIELGADGFSHRFISLA
jgi:putative phosphoesterase